MDHTSILNHSSMNASGMAALRDSAAQIADTDVDNDPENRGGSVRVVSGSGFRYVVPFPWRLHQMLDDIEKSGEDAVVSWLPDGFHFQVHNPQLFMQQIIPKFFKQKSYKSFQRQLHLYGFQRVLEGPNRGAYFHESFVKEDRKLALEITRIKAPKRRRTGKGSDKDIIKAEDTRSKEMSPLAKFIPFQPQDSLGSTSPSNNSMGAARPLAYSSSTNQTCNHLQYSTNVLRSDTSSSPTLQDIETPSVAETYEWLINAGVPFSAFDPIAIEPQRVRPTAKDGIGSDLFECADEIKSLFSAPSSPAPTSPISSPHWTSTDAAVARQDVILSIQPATQGTIHFDGGILDDLAPLDLQWGI
mmetsp:Transcript_41146/g.63398  ORF Transcript_41146/g.63398 Transcript_41146/m.63398 type:complete len:358 (+) Transcript_41146:93-1166(+)|eukprot:CAMPEP_0117046984 /NCGR_PEP_ID=MMETSP0472-20121206/32476_1 /TAXON_ID=693140 ORGANISM="Tiarina fusus, Strain LIS" /NCGR_SAMPLE_ID=MMETSP0472 /ASSEMBLY_ACC=CAM_ASM_000603 /LENGTH=357 /DNA_ID=CAMNT_0004759523 /DNA_START=109 /DNA_END=1182 /DNA_ORIENTATION=-